MSGGTRRGAPRATYRVQLVPEQGFDGLAGLVEHFAELGVSHLYLSPALEAAPGSRHGYDVVDPTRIRAELGGEEGLDRLRDAAHAAGLGLVLDIVPNHVGLVSPHNPWWWDVLAHGPDARFARHLDVDWRPGAHGQPSLLLAELGRELEEELADDDLRLAHQQDGRPPAWRIVYHDHAWPVRPGSLEAVGLEPDDVEATLAAAGETRVLRSLLDRQHYRLAHWRRANDELDHRRFFAIKELGGVRIEDPAVFDDAHAAILPRVADGTFDGLRVDHPDGLLDPVGYLERLRAEVGDGVWLVVEKILERHEPYRRDWPIDGTVGYEFADLVLGLHVDGEAAPILEDLHACLVGTRLDRGVLDDQAKRLVIDRLFGTEVRRVTARLADAAGLETPEARELLIELLAAWPVYRTYVRPDIGEVTQDDREIITRALARVRARHGDLPGLERVRGILLLEPGVEPERRAARDAFVWAFQQLTGPVVAKGVEDTALYRDLRFVAVNEVGGDPAQLGRDPGEVHAAHVRAQDERPATMRLSSTHDTKRSADVRARLSVLSQDPDHWVRTVLRWHDRTAAHRGPVGPTPGHEHLTFQTLVGAWPLDADRLEAYLLKAAREGARATDHLDPDPDYEADLARYARGLLGDADFVADLAQVVDEIREPGWLTSLAMTLVKLTAPGVPDVYQGEELWDLSLVDPDNRRAVDHDRRRALLADLRAAPGAEEVMGRLEEGLPKLHLVQRALALRAERPSSFGPDGTYEPLWATGRRSSHVFAFARGSDVVVVTPRLVRGLGRAFGDWEWETTELALPPGRWTDVLAGTGFDGGPTALGDLLERFPVALLARG
jgi:(1->4)-alpha-D-glucan 1-alpha-D-glucosylmutase